MPNPGGGPVILPLVARLAGLFLCIAVAACAADTVLILPLSNASRNRSLDWIGDSVSETVIENLAAEGLPAAPAEVRDLTTQEMGLRRYALMTRATALEAAINADAALVLYGSFEIQPQTPTGAVRRNLRINAHLLDARRMRRVGDFLLTGPLADLSALQTSLAWQALRALAPQGGMSEEEFLRRHPPVRIDALENYARGLRASSIEQKHRFFATAARLAPGFSPACYQLARLDFFAMKDYAAAASWFEKVAGTDLHYRESLFYLGASRYMTGEYAAAAAALRKLVAIAPLPEALNNLGAVLIRLNDPAAASTLASAVEANPADPDFQFNAGYALWRAGDFDAAAAHLRACLQSDAGDETATLLLGRCLQRQGPRPGEMRFEALERLKLEYNEAAWLALKSLVSRQ